MAFEPDPDREQRLRDILAGKKSSTAAPGAAHEDLRYLLGALDAARESADMYGRGLRRCEELGRINYEAVNPAAPGLTWDRLRISSRESWINGAAAVARRVREIDGDAHQRGRADENERIATMMRGFAERNPHPEAGPLFLKLADCIDATRNRLPSDLPDRYRNVCRERDELHAEVKWLRAQRDRAVKALMIFARDQKGEDGLLCWCSRAWWPSAPPEHDDRCQQARAVIAEVEKGQ